MKQYTSAPGLASERRDFCRSRGLVSDVETFERRGALWIRINYRHTGATYEFSAATARKLCAYDRERFLDGAS